MLDRYTSTNTLTRMNATIQTIKSVLSVCFAVLLLPGVSVAQELIIENAKILDPATQTVTEGAVTIVGGKILSIGEVPGEPFDGPSIDLGGKWLVPGFNDMHTHSYGNMGPSQAVGDFVMTEVVAKRMLYAGVTGFLDLFSAEDYIFNLRQQQRASKISGADIYAAGPILTAPGGHGTEYGVPTRIAATPEEAKEEVDALAEKQPDVVKLVYDNAARMPTMQKATMKATVAAARAHNIPVVAHIGSWDDVRDVILAGVQAITHTPRGNMPADIPALMKEHGVITIPTLAVQTEFSHLVKNPEGLDHPLLAAVAPDNLLAAYRDTSAYDPGFKGFLAYQAGMRESIFASVAAMAAAGIPVLAGTDGGNPGIFQGYSVHREMALLVEAGLSPWQALASATTAAGPLIGQSFGMQPGDVANLVVLDASPLEDINNTTSISMVIHHGAVVDRETLLPDTNASQEPMVHAPFEGPLVDDFEKQDLVSALGHTWTAMTDKVMGGNSTLVHSHNNGMLEVEGAVAPMTGRPGFASLTLQLNPTGAPMDISGYDGVEISLEVTDGGVGLQLMTPSITNFDYHATLIMPTEGKQTLQLPFSSFRQMWSGQVPWTGTDVVAVALMVSNFQPLSFAYNIDSISFYKNAAAQD